MQALGIKENINAVLFIKNKEVYFKLNAIIEIAKNVQDDQAL